MIIYLYRCILLICCHYFSAIICGIFLCVSGHAQNPVFRKPPVSISTLGTKDSVYIDFNKEITVQLIPFEEIFALAVANSPLINYEKAAAAAQQANGKLSKLQFLQAATGAATYSTGNQAIISTGTTTTPGSTIGQIANGYRVGVNFQLSIYDIVGRKQLVNQANANYQSAIHRRETAELQLKRELIDLYQDLITAQHLLKLNLQGEVAATVAYQIGEVEFKQRKIDADAFTNVSKSYFETKASIEQAKGVFLKYLYNLEAIVGVPIKNLKRK